jgi:hypothetical protein
MRDVDSDFGACYIIFYNDPNLSSTRGGLFDYSKSPEPNKIINTYCILFLTALDKVTFFIPHIAMNPGGLQSPKPSKSKKDPASRSIEGCVLFESVFFPTTP